MHITVKELIEALSKMPSNAPVEAISPVKGYGIPITEVRHIPSDEEELPAYPGEGVVKLS